MPTSDFYEEHAHAIRPTNIVLRDSLGTLAVAILERNPNFSTMSYVDMLLELQAIIEDLQNTYHQQNFG